MPRHGGRHSPSNLHDPAFVADLVVLQTYCEDADVVLPPGTSAGDRAEFLQGYCDGPKGPANTRSAFDFIQTCRRAMQGHAVNLPWELRCAVNTAVRDFWVALHCNYRKPILRQEAKEIAALRTAKDVLRRNILYLRGKTYCSADHTGPTAEETVPLLAPLIQLHHYGMYTVEGQPSKVESGVSDFTGKPLTLRQRGYINAFVRRGDWADLLAYLHDMKRRSEMDPGVTPPFGFAYIVHDDDTRFETERFRRNREDISGEPPDAKRTLSIADISADTLRSMHSFSAHVDAEMWHEFPVFLRVFALKSRTALNIEQLLLGFYTSRAPYIPFDEPLQDLLRPAYGALLDVRTVLKQSFFWLPEPFPALIARDFALAEELATLQHDTEFADARVETSAMPPSF
jgi:hypothetical protein